MAHFRKVEVFYYDKIKRYIKTQLHLLRIFFVNNSFGCRYRRERSNFVDKSVYNVI